MGNDKKLIPLKIWEILYQVLKSTLPVWGRPKIDWKADTDRSVIGP